MIVTLTANPSLDRTINLSAPLARGQVQRVSRVTVEPGGKGVNVARVVHAAGHPAFAVLPAPADDPILTALREVGVRYRAVPVAAGVRTNIAITEPDGTTTKLNGFGNPLDAAAITALETLLVEMAAGAEWVVLSGSLPPGAPSDLYPRLGRRLRPLGVKVAVDTSDEPLRALVADFPAAAPDLIKPNSEELAQLIGADAEQLEAAARRGDPSAALDGARRLVELGAKAVLASLGASGAVLVTDTGAWYASPPPIVPRSTVGAGDSSVAGYLLADCGGRAAPDRLRTAVAYGSAAASMAGTASPRPEHLKMAEVVVTDLG